MASVLNYIEGVFFLLLLIHLTHTRLIQTYRLFAAFVLFRLLRLCVLTFVPLSPRSYAYAYFGSEPITWILATLTVLELYSLVLQNHPGIARISRIALPAAMVMAVITAVATLTIDVVKTSATTYALDIMYLITRVVMSSLLFFLVLLTFFLYLFPIPISKNVAAHCLLLAAYTGTRTVVLFLRNIGGVEVSPGLDPVMTILQLACLALWCTLLRPAWEMAPALRGRSLNPEQEQRLLGNLNLLNDTLSRSVRRHQ